MAANKFATMLHRNTSKLTTILVYTVLEWILIVLLLLNSLFSYLIIKFATFFGLKTPCLWCSRIDHVLDSGKDKHCYRDLLCQNHAMEISRLGYCLNHGRLAEACDMCEDCSFSQPRPENRIAFGISIDGRLKMENGDKDVKCSCCNMSLNGGFYSKILWNHGLFKNTWDVVDYPHKEKDNYDDGESSDSSSKLESPIEQIKVPERFLGSSDSEDEIRFRTDGMGEKVCWSSQCEKSGVGLVSEEAAVEPDDQLAVDNSNFEGNPVLEISETDTVLIRECNEDLSCEILPIRSANYMDNDRLVSLELIDILTAKTEIRVNNRELDTRELSDAAAVQLSENDSNDNQGEGFLVFNLEFQKDTESVVELKTVSEEITPINDETKPRKIANSVLFVFEDEDSSVLPAEEANGNETGETQGQVSLSRATSPMSRDGEITEAETMEICFEAEEAHGNEIGETQDQNALSQPTSTISRDGEIIEAETMENCFEVKQQVYEQSKGSILEEQDDHAVSQTMSESGSLEKIEENMNNDLSISTERNEGDEEKVPETPTNMEGIHNLHKRLLFERKETGTESLDGSVISELEAGDGASIERLKAALKAERKALSALYSELEEERSASAVAANQTMAMITRLQEEKAAMQMEALQYQRMMEEQSEYDQEALQLLNELMVKREKEKQELEKELELSRKKVLLHEAKEKRQRMRKANEHEMGQVMKNGVSSASSSAGDSDELSIDLNEGDDHFYSLQENGSHTPVDGVLSLGKGQENIKSLSTLDESLADFEEERLSILEQLKVLEEKLFTLGDEETFEHINGGFCDQEGMETANGISSNGKHQIERRNLGTRPKMLLPLFDAMSGEHEAELGQEKEDSDPNFKSENKQVSIEEEVDQVYERLQALEADREFLKHCISSLKKGGKGMDLLQEILQHLRDLRTVELRVRNMGDALA